MSENGNTFKLGLYLDDNILCENIFDADCYNPYVRYSVDIREYLGDILNNFKSILSKDTDRDLYYEFNNINFLSEYYKQLNKYGKEIINNLKFRQVKNVELKFVLFINENTVVERFFNIKKFNYDAIQSYDLISYMDFVKSLIEKKLKNNDIKRMWEDNDLINYYNINIQQIRELDERSRKKMLFRIYNK